MKKRRTKEKIGLHPVMTLIILSFIVIVVSGILGFFNVQSTFNKISATTGEYQVTTEAVNSLLSLRGLKYIFTTTVNSFANFAVLPNLIIILIGIGIMVKSGFLKTVITLLTKKAQKKTVTYVFILICILASIVGNLSYIIFIPLGALLFLYGKRNPLIGIIAAFAGLTCGSGLSILLTSIDSSLITLTVNNANAFAAGTTISAFGFVLVMSILIIILSFVLTSITENYIAKKMPKYEFPEEEVEDELVITKKKMKGLVLAGIFGVIYLIIFIYNIIPGLPFSGNLLDYSQNLYIDKLFSYNSFFSNGFVFIVAVFFVILGLAYGIGAKTINNNKEFIDALGHSLNGMGKIFVTIFAASAFINIFKYSNIGPVVVGTITNYMSNSAFAALPLLIVLFFGSFIAALFMPNTINCWALLAGVVPTFMNLGISPAFTQFVFRLGSSAAVGLTPVFAYFVVYMAFIKYYNQGSKTLTIGEAIRYQLPYAIITALIFLLFIIVWYILGFPLGYGTSVTL